MSVVSSRSLFLLFRITADRSISPEIYCKKLLKVRYIFLDAVINFRIKLKQVHGSNYFNCAIYSQGNIFKDVIYASFCRLLESYSVNTDEIQWIFQAKGAKTIYC